MSDAQFFLSIMVAVRRRRSSLLWRISLALTAVKGRTVQPSTAPAKRPGRPPLLPGLLMETQTLAASISPGIREIQTYGRSSEQSD